MIRPDRLYDHLAELGIEFYTGVPDSLLKDFLACLQFKADRDMHIITANEGLAVGLATGYHISTGKIPLVYLQNSGLGNIINPITSLADQEMYSIPMLLLIGWRGRPGVKDEPQHKKMGRVMLDLLTALEIPYFILDNNEEDAFEKFANATRMAREGNKPVALIAVENIFEEYSLEQHDTGYMLTRESLIKDIIQVLKGDEIVVCTTGKTGREFYEQNILAGNKIKKYFLSVGAMGHAGHIALGLRMHSDEKVVLIDGDGALLMHMGSLATTGNYATGKFLHILINNGVHESVGGQPTQGSHTDFCTIARACGYEVANYVSDEKSWADWLEHRIDFSVSLFVEIRSGAGSRSDLGRPVGIPSQWKDNLMNALNTNK